MLRCMGAGSRRGSFGGGGGVGGAAAGGGSTATGAELDATGAGAAMAGTGFRGAATTWAFPAFGGGAGRCQSTALKAKNAPTPIAATATARISALLAACCRRMRARMSASSELACSLATCRS
jgi:hypothetical protein